MTPVPPPQIEISRRRLILDPLNASSVKKFYVYDVGTGLPTDIYYTQSGAELMDACLRQRFEYVATVSGIEVQKETWETAFWDSSWDII